MKPREEYKYKWYLFGCKDAGYLHEKKQDKGLNFGEKLLYYFHMASCHLCRKYVKHLELIKKNILDYALDIKLDFNKKEKIQKTIQNNLK
ncbi:MAG: hypothetical protein N3F09_09860 [Bacteroidia bacterium]|nr:hypothetical protein [Bacteroidia bacterium]